MSSVAHKIPVAALLALFPLWPCSAGCAGPVDGVAGTCALDPSSRLSTPLDVEGHLEPWCAYTPPGSTDVFGPMAQLVLRPVSTGSITTNRVAFLLPPDRATVDLGTERYGPNGSVRWDLHNFETSYWTSGYAAGTMHVDPPTWPALSGESAEVVLRFDDLELLGRSGRMSGEVSVSLSIPGHE